MRAVATKVIFVEIPNVVNGVTVSTRNRPASPLEARTAQRARRRLSHLLAKRDRLMKQIETIQSKCKHPTFYDVRGHIYDERYCASCDRHLGSI
jgi:hypothetical protein